MQIGVLLAVAAALKKPEILSSLSGSVAFMAVPAEEFIEIEYRENLRKQGELTYLVGKAELIKLGEFDDVDMAMITHTSSSKTEKHFFVGMTANGAISKVIQFIGKASHAGASPDKGVNALNAAMIALSAIHAQRETYRDEDAVRVHPVITKGGDSVNIVPSDVRMETFIRGKSIEAIKDANEKVDRALRAGALAVGAKVKITTLPGYIPMALNPDLVDIWRNNASSLIGQENVTEIGHAAGSSDVGDLSQIMPVVFPFASGASGTGHGDNYIISNYEIGVVEPAKAMAMTVIDLLADGAEAANTLLSKNKPLMTKQEYLDFRSSLTKETEYEE